jgi:hypothetical protein
MAGNIAESGYSLITTVVDLGWWFTGFGGINIIIFEVSTSLSE